MMSANLRAFLALIRWAEGTGGPDGYRTLVGGKLFDSFDDHPRKIQTIRFGQQEIHSTAAGAYQFLTATWDRCAKALDLPDFSPECQDRAAIYLIEQRKALPDIEQGRLREALERCSWEWASLPPSRYNQPVKSLAACEAIFERAGGTITQPAGTASTSATQKTPPPSPAPAAPSIGEQSMAIPALVAAAASALLPIVADLFRARASKTSSRNAEIVDAVSEAAPALVEIAKQVAGGGNEQAAAEKILADKELQAQFRAQVALKWSDLEPFLRFEEESKEKARGFAERMTAGDGPQWRQIGFGFLVAVMSLTIVVGGGAMFWNLMSSPQLDPGQKGLILGALIASFTTVVGYFFGSSATSRQKDQTIAEQAKR